MDRHGKNIFGSPKISPNKNLFELMLQNRLSDAFLLDGKQQRSIVENSISNVCKFRGYGMFAINVRTNHAHCVVAAAKKPEPIMTAFKANATRELREAGLVGESQQVWSRGGSQRYLCKSNHVTRAVDYVLYGQGDDLPDF